MQSNTQPNARSKNLISTGRVISALPVLFLLMDSVIKLVSKPTILVASSAVWKEAHDVR